MMISMQLALSSALHRPLCLFSPVPSPLSFPRAEGLLAPWHLCLTSGEQEKTEAVCAPSSHLGLILFFLLPDKVLEQTQTVVWAFCGHVDPKRGVNKEHSHVGDRVASPRRVEDTQVPVLFCTAAS